VTDLIDGGPLFGLTERVGERQHLDRRADLHALGAGGDGGGDGDRRGQH